MTDDKASIQNIANRIRAVRRAKRFTQEEVAKKAGISPNHYAQIEQGLVNTSAANLLNIIDALGVESKEILSK